MLRMFLSYMAVGLVFALWGVVYALLFLAGWDHWLVATALFVGGFVTARVLWQRLSPLDEAKRTPIGRFVSASGATADLWGPPAVAGAFVSFGHLDFGAEPVVRNTTEVPASANGAKILLLVA